MTANPNDLGELYQAHAQGPAPAGRIRYVCTLCNLVFWQSPRGAESEAMLDHAEAHARKVRP